MRVIPCLLSALLLAGLSSAQTVSASGPAASQVDILITDATIIDGTGARSFTGDVAIEGDRILFVGDAPDSTRARRIIPAAGRVLSPGFIDMHAHGDAEDDDFSAFVAMGVTTIVLGQDGAPAYDPRDPKEAAPERFLASWMDRVAAQGAQLNIAAVSGHGALRRAAQIPDGTRALAPEQQSRLNQLLAAELAAGSFGLSTGLEYVPGRYAETAELRPLAKLVADVDGLVLSHMRTEDDGAIEGAIDELTDYGGSARVHISHLKVVFGRGEQTARQLLDFIAAKQKAGARLSADIYPYTAGYTSSLSLLFPEWALPPADYVQVAKARRGELLDYLRKRMIRRNGPQALLFGSAPYIGKTLAGVAKDQDRPFEEVLLALGPRGAHGAHFIMDEALQDQLVAHPLTAISTDGGPGARHPRSTGTYARLIERYVRDMGRLSLEEAVRKSSGLPASLLRLDDRGVIRAGAKADLLLFDPAEVKARSDYLDPFAPSLGFDFVLINGAVVRENGIGVPARPGRVLKRRQA